MIEQIILSSTIIILLGLFIWGKYRYDALAVGALVVLVSISSFYNLEIIDPRDALEGFANPAVMTVALVLIISQGLKNAGLSALSGKLLGIRTFTEIQFLIISMLIAAT